MSMEIGYGRAQTARPPAFAVLDLRLGDGNGLELVGPLRQARPDIRIVVLTGYGNIATAVAAVKEGAVDYLAKPADADAIEQALTAHPAAAQRGGLRPDRPFLRPQDWRVRSRRLASRAMSVRECRSSLARMCDT